MSGNSDAPRSVLVVDDEEGIVELYAAWLEADYDVRTATDGADALDRVDDSIDVVFLDRKMPDMMGEAVLEAIRARPLDCQVAMVTGFEPDEEILDAGFDDYLVKPVSRAELLAVVDQLFTRMDYDQDLQSYFSLLSKRAAIEQSRDKPSTGVDERHLDALDREIAEKRRAVEAQLASLSGDEIRAMIRSGIFDAPSNQAELSQ